MQVKIKSCKNKNYWYKDRIGEVFSAAKKTGVYNNDKVYIVDTTKENMQPSVAYVAVDDAEIIKKEKNKPIEEVK